MEKTDKKSYVKIGMLLVILVLSIIPLWILDLWLSKLYVSIILTLYSCIFSIGLIILIIKLRKENRKNIILFLLITIFIILLGVNAIKELVTISKDIISGAHVIELKNCIITSDKNYGYKHSYFTDYYLEGIDSNGKKYKLQTDYYTIPNNSTVEVKYFENTQIVKEINIIEEKSNELQEVIQDQKDELENTFNKIYNTN